ncbi:hypothetical protein LZ554_009023 [Drepanopeziza brunnea f. sp. 'monogermtubi']|nr:hypothetical protein LZ554_009023 [Drepanopeziza brunnea f. sp. 'monogermtubi']
MDAFKCFMKLPSELRIKIWKITFPEPRIVPIRFNRATQQYTSNAPPPAALHVSIESRAVFLETYTNLILSPRHRSAVFVDLARETIYFDQLDCSPEGDLSLDLAHSPHADRILYVAIHAHVWDVLRMFRYEVLSEVNAMRNLRTLALVMSKDYDRGFQQRRIEYHGSESLIIDSESNTVGSELRDVQFAVENLRWELRHKLELQGGKGHVPNVQMWLL